MNAVAPYCSRCGSKLEEDCDFCPACGARCANRQTVAESDPPPHSWMNDGLGATSEADPPTPSTHQPRQSAPLRVVTSLPDQSLQYVPSVVNPQTARKSSDSLAFAGGTMGLVALCLMIVGLVPCLGWLNYFNLAFSFATLLLCIVGVSSASSNSARSAAVIGLVLASLADFVGFIRLVLGGGCL